MIDAEKREKIMKALACHADSKACDKDCPYYKVGTDVLCSEALARDALSILQAAYGNKIINTEWFIKAVNAIQDGIADKLSKENVTVYRVVNIIRIDINLGQGR